MKRFCIYMVACCMILSSCTEDSMPSNMAFGTPTSASVVEADAITASQSSLSFTADGGSQSITITSNFAWSVISSPSWVTISPTSGISGSTSVTITASKNTDTSDLSGTITLGNSSKSVSISISQNGGDYDISASVSSLSFSADGGSEALTVTSNFSWVTVSKPTWIDISPTSGSSGSTSVTISASKNSSTSAQSGTITLGNSSKTVAISVGQEAASVSISGNTYTISGVSFKMIAVEGGTFTMGGTSEQGSDAYSDEFPTHTVTLSTFSIGETEVTQALWQAVMGQTPTSDGEQWNRYDGLGSNNPAYYVSWDDCQTFIARLNALTGKTFRLPTEAEWEYAARGGNKSRGYKYAGSNTIGDVAWNDGYKSHEVKTKQANELGLYDMSGNVGEWCQDWYGGYSSAKQTNPTGPSTGSRRVFRGGGWDDIAKFCRVSFRFYDSPVGRHLDLGLRLAL